jgi:hypothetical protein
MNSPCECKTEKLVSPQESKAMPWVSGTVEHPAGQVLKIKTEWSRNDYIGQVKARTSSFRMQYRVPPGLYAAGAPDESSPVLVTANYKLSFDQLRRELSGIDAWILLLDTQGINVWCAAGKGLFGTAELVNKIKAVSLDKIVKHRRIILPQLGAPGIHAHVVKKATGFTVSFGPVYAKDIPAYLRAGFKATKEMRSVRFGFGDRLILTPMELNPAFSKLWILALAFFILFGLQPEGFIFKDAWTGGIPFLLMSIASIFIGALLTPLLLPFIPFRSFAIKGWFLGAFLFVITFPVISPWLDHNPYLLAASYLFFPAICSFLALNFTGSTNFTHPSGVKKELRISIPVYITVTIISVLCIIFDKLTIWGIL